MAKRKNRSDSVYDRLEALLGDHDTKQESLAQMTEDGPHGGLRNINVYRWYTGYARLKRGCVAFFFFGKDATQGWVIQTGEISASEKLEALKDLKKRKFRFARTTGMGRALNRAIAEHEAALGSSSSSASSSFDSGSAGVSASDSG